METFALGKSRYDQNTYMGRLRHFLDIVDPRTLFVTQKQLDAAVKLLDNYKAGTLPPTVTDSQLWKAQKIKQAIIHPDTNEKILMPFRMSGFVPFGSITVIGLLQPNPTTASVFFWQFLNQSHNAGVNYANRNATKKTPVSRFLMGYFGATASAVLLGVSLHNYVKMAKDMPEGRRVFVQRVLPYPVVAFANAINVILMRKNELSEGIEVVDENGTVVGTSQIAARVALFETVLTRMVLPAPVLLIPPVILSRLEKTSFWHRSPRLRLPLHAMVCIACFSIALPLSISLYPQTRAVQTRKLEPSIQIATKAQTVYFNKGL